MEITDNETFEKVFDLLDKYEQLGPLPGILLPFIEAFLPFLPLFIFVIASSVAYGLVKGFIYSWLGSILGAIAVFLIIRQFSDKKIFIKIRSNKQVKKVTVWVEEHGFGPLFILLCFPFAPSSLINVVAGLSRVSAPQFILAVILGKALMIFSIAYIGSSVSEFAENPIRTVIVLLSILLFWILGKYLERIFKRKVYEKSYPKRSK